MPFVKCSVGGCSRRLQPILKVDPRDRDTWLYTECEECGRAACGEHTSWQGGRMICDRCLPVIQSKEAPVIELGLQRLVPSPQNRLIDGSPKQPGGGV
jgi:hypothetical protein